MAKRVGLREKAVEHAEPGARAGKKVERFIYDGAIPGFYVRVSPKGKRSFGLQYRAGDGSTRRVKIAKWVDGQTGQVDAARREALRLLAEVAGGGDPSAARWQDDATSDTLEAVAKQFIASIKAQGQRDWKEAERRLAIYVLPELGSRPMGTISRRDVVALMDRIASRQVQHPENGEVRGGPVMANRVLSGLRRLFNWAIARDVISASPVVGIERPGGKEKPRDRLLKDGELREVWTATDALDVTRATLVKVLLLTGQRRGEVAGMRWSEIDDDTRVWTIPSARTKNKQAHEVPLFPALDTLLAALTRDGDCVFRGRYDEDADKPVAGFVLIARKLNKAIKAARQARGVTAQMPRWTLHDLRRTMRSRLSPLCTTLGLDLEIAERVINHVPAGVRAVYDLHRYREEKRALLTAWSEELQKIVAGSDTPAPDA